ncbi:cytidine deaminase [Streptococcus gallolyticus]|uniref:cytidine deaminase n=1 Tax=Streptococcus hepaticus TaxID=3349163 RepID=UPI001C958CF5|nr:cytidine deaminase [Streptococcus gallolyticus]MBY5041268.1 cytidine deaminase [Streptococcus gallolyticus]
MADTKLVDLAIEASKNAYVPYSNFPIGAVLVAKNGRVFTGCNVENASFGLTNCGERTAIFKAISEGEREFKELVIFGKTEQPISPCGACRQVMVEFFDKDLPVTLVAEDRSTVVMTVQELLPYSFTDLK